MTTSRKRQKVEDSSFRYTQGPLDDEFGQHGAFPLNNIDSDDLVSRYLMSVREEARADRLFHYVERVKKESTSASSHEEQIVPQEKVDEFMSTFTALKEAREVRLERSELDYNCFIPNSAAQWRKKVFSEQPDANFLEVLDHTTVIKLIVYYTKWLLMSMPEELGKWIFVTFIRLDRELEHKEMAIVRDLAKKAIKIREKIDELTDESPVIQHIVDMILSIVAMHFGQRDLLNKST